MLILMSVILSDIVSKVINPNLSSDFNQDLSVILQELKMAKNIYLAKNSYCPSV